MSYSYLPSGADCGTNHSFNFSVIFRSLESISVVVTGYMMPHSMLWPQGNVPSPAMPSSFSHCPERLCCSNLSRSQLGPYLGASSCLVAWPEESASALLIPPAVPPTLAAAIPTHVFVVTLPGYTLFILHLEISVILAICTYGRISSYIPPQASHLT